jgi:HD-GYP domain-containing protein (c-di-GMP phosphodiesterase class II)
VASDASVDGERVRAAEVIGALCLATDLGMGFPFEHGLRTTLVASRLAERLGVDRATASETFYACLLSHSGCTADAHVTAEVFGDSLTTHLNPVMYGSRREILAGIVRALPEPERAAPVRAMQVARRLPRAARVQRPHFAAMCEVAQMLAEGVGLPPSVQGHLAYLFERWDGEGGLGRAKGDAIPLPMRIFHVAVDATFQSLLGGDEHVAGVMRERAGHAFDPEVAACLADDAGGMLASGDEGSVWEETLAREPGPPLVLAGESLDRALTAMGGFADLICPYLAGHSVAVAECAAAAGTRCRLPASSAVALRRAALVHDLGRVVVGARVWQKPGRLTADEWERVRLHPYYTERVLSRSSFLAALAPVACAHHERLDGSGYHRGIAGAELTLPARLLAAADAFCAMTASRPHREPIAPDRAAQALADEASAGRLDPEAVAAVIEAAGERVPRIERLADLTEREVQVVTMLACGLQTKQIAGALGISVKTADRHIEHAYRKIGVSSRAAAALFAMQHGLLAWGEFPIPRPPVRT